MRGIKTVGAMTWEEAEKHAHELLEAAKPGGWAYKRFQDYFDPYFLSTGTGYDREVWCTHCGQWHNVAQYRDPACWNNPDVWDAHEIEVREEFLPWNDDIRKQHVDYLKTRGITGKDTQGKVIQCPHCGRCGEVRYLKSGVDHLNQIHKLIFWGKSSTTPGVYVAMSVMGNQEYAAAAAKQKRFEDLGLFAGLLGPNDLRGMLTVAPDGVWVLDLRGSKANCWKFTRDVWILEGQVHIWTNNSGYVVSYYKDRNWHQTTNATTGLSHPSVGATADLRSIRDAFQGSRLEFVADYFQHALLSASSAGLHEIFEAAKHPAIEYAYKRGWRTIAYDMIGSPDRYNFRAVSVPKLFKVSPERWQEIMQTGKQPNIVAVQWIQELDRLHNVKNRIRYSDAVWLSEYGFSIGTTRQNLTRLIDNILRPGLSLKKIRRYIERYEDPQDFGIRIEILDYLDYLEQLRRLHVPLESDVLYPKDFHAAHMERSVQLKAMATRENDVRIHEVVEQYQGMVTWHNSGYVLQLMPSAEAILNEANAQHHCMAMYTDRYANGSTLLATLRLESAPDTPRYSVELDTQGGMIQCRGYRNDTTAEGAARRKADAPALDAFWKSYKAHVKRCREYGKDPKGDGSEPKTEATHTTQETEMEERTA